MQYYVCEINGKQYLVYPDKNLIVDKLAATGTLTVDKVLLEVGDGSKVEIGTPYLKQSLQFEVVGNKKLKKIRVATYKAKANHHRVIGSRREVTELKLIEKPLKEEKSKKTDVKS